MIKRPENLGISRGILSDPGETTIPNPKLRSLTVSGTPVQI